MKCDFFYFTISTDGLIIELKKGMIFMYKVTLSACGNIDHGENPYLNIVNDEVVEAKVAEVETIEECQQIVRDYINENDLGGGNWTGGDVFKDGQKVGRISYNSRFWEIGSKYCPR